MADDEHENAGEEPILDEIQVSGGKYPIETDPGDIEMAIDDAGEGGMVYDDTVSGLRIDRMAIDYIVN
ncbi:hypothetical protein PG994_013350 [Apiospora phragmitis]|uniref:Uncharacterized protein n=1 Tax=Apiospora phragmitis TaxID=2905665 RepID=A0ABR1T8E0_9PEZI